MLDNWREFVVVVVVEVVWLVGIVEEWVRSFGNGAEIVWPLLNVHME